MQQEFYKRIFIFFVTTCETTVSCKRRNSTIEILRFAFMFLIVVIYAYYHGNPTNFEAIFAYGNSIVTASHLSIFSLGMIGVTGFMFISGYYGIRMNRKKLVDMLAMMHSTMLY